MGETADPKGETIQVWTTSDQAVDALYFPHGPNRNLAVDAKHPEHNFDGRTSCGHGI